MSVLQKKVPELLKQGQSDLCLEKPLARAKFSAQNGGMSQDFLSCTYSAICSGCDWLYKPASEQKHLKITHLRETWSRVGVRASLPEAIGFRSTVNGASRDRVDLTLDESQGLGLFNRFRTGLVDLQGCPQLSPRLESALQEFRRVSFPIRRGSVRLRVAPDGTKGAWLDFANIDVKALLDEQATLRVLLNAGWIVEIGQRRKRLVERGELLKLDDPVLFPWFETYVDGRAVPLFATIGTFTQPGFKVNEALIEEVTRLAPRGKRAAEFGAGIGNFTLPLTSRFEHVEVYEVDALALEALSRSLAATALTDKVAINAGNYQGDKALSLNFDGIDLLLVDPPRSGLMKFVDALASTVVKPTSVLYVSCFAESFATDSDRLLEMGYQLKSISIVDQFPQSRHYETVALLTLST